MFTRNMMLMPGQELRRFDVLHPETRENERGQEVITGYTPIGTIKAILAQAKPEEIERWRQINHSITHKIIMGYKPPFDVRPGDIFELMAPGEPHCSVVGDGATELNTGWFETARRRFYMQTMPYNPGNLGHYTIFYCNERMDVT